MEEDDKKTPFTLSEEEVGTPVTSTYENPDDNNMTEVTKNTQYYKENGFQGDQDNEALARVLGRSKTAADEAERKAVEAKRGLFQQTYLDPYMAREESEESKRRKRNKRMIAAIGDGITALANFAGAAHGATPLKQTSMTAALGAKEDKDRKERLQQSKLAQDRLLKLEESARKAEADASAAGKEHNRNVLSAIGIRNNKERQESNDEFREKEFEQKVSYQNASLEIRKKVAEEAQKVAKERLDAYNKKRSSGGHSSHGRSGGLTAQQIRDRDNARWYGELQSKYPDRYAEIMGNRINWRTGVVKHPSNSREYESLRAQYDSKYPKRKIR